MSFDRGAHFNDPLGYTGLIVAAIVAIAIILPILLHTLRQEQAHDSEPAPEGTTPAAPPSAAVPCPACGRMNRAPLEAERAQCGHCRAELFPPAKAAAPPARP